MNESEIAQFWVLVARFQTFDQREGQAMMNALWRVAPPFYDEISGSLRDPFYQDSKIPEFRAYLGI